MDTNTDTDNLVKKKSWYEWIYSNQNNILFGIFFICLIGGVTLFTETPSSIINIESLQSLLDNLFTITDKKIYNQIGAIVQKAIFKDIHSQKSIIILEKILKDNQNYPSLIKDSQKFEEIINKIIEEIKKI